MNDSSSKQNVIFVMYSSTGGFEDLVEIHIFADDVIRDLKKDLESVKHNRKRKKKACGRFTSFVRVSIGEAQFRIGGGSFASIEMAGGMDVHKNKYIEEWAHARENLEKTFRFNRRNITLALIFGIAVPFITYKGVVDEFHKQDMDAEQPRRKFLGSQ